MRFLLSVVAAATILTAPPVIASEQLGAWQPVTFHAPVPCAVACPHWLSTLNSDLDGDGAEEVAFSPCGNPNGTGGSLPPFSGPFQHGGTYADVIVGPAPEGTALLRFDSTSSVDWDTYICSTDGEELAVGATPLDSCDSPLLPDGPFPIGCTETAVAPAEEGEHYILRAYNWSDPFPLDGRYCFSSMDGCEEAS